VSGHAKKSNRRIENDPAFQVRSSQTEIHPHSGRNTSGDFRSDRVPARLGHKMLPRRPSVPSSGAIENVSSRRSTLPDLQRQAPLVSSPFLAHQADGTYRRIPQLDLGNTVMLAAIPERELHVRITMSLRGQINSKFFPSGTCPENRESLYKRESRSPSS
jgi:hypothetical protein